MPVIRARPFSTSATTCLCSIRTFPPGSFGAYFSCVLCSTMWLLPRSFLKGSGKVARRSFVHAASIVNSSVSTALRATRTYVNPSLWMCPSAPHFPYCGNTMYVAAKHLTDYSSISRNNLNSLDSIWQRFGQYAQCCVQLYNRGNVI